MNNQHVEFLLIKITFYDEMFLVPGPTRGIYRNDPT
jgi:hypothetical protein